MEKSKLVFPDSFTLTEYVLIEKPKEAEVNGLSLIALLTENEIVEAFTQYRAYVEPNYLHIKLYN